MLLISEPSFYPIFDASFLSALFVESNQCAEDSRVQLFFSLPRKERQHFSNLWSNGPCFQVDILMLSWLVCGFWCNIRTEKSPKGTKNTHILWLRPLWITRVSQAPIERNLFPQSAKASRKIGKIQIRAYVYLLTKQTALSTWCPPWHLYTWISGSFEGSVEDTCLPDVVSHPGIKLHQPVLGPWLQWWLVGFRSLRF